eukprot:46436-Karenia_brevis.AAC.1
MRQPALLSCTQAEIKTHCDNVAPDLQLQKTANHTSRDIHKCGHADGHVSELQSSVCDLAVGLS